MDRESLIAEIGALGISQRQEGERLISLIPDEDLAAIDETFARISDETDAYRQLGEETGVPALGIADAARAGKEAFMRIRSQVREAVCRSAAVQEVCRRPSLQGSAVVVAIIVGALTDANISGINLPLVAVLTVRAGVDEFCSKIWDDHGKKDL